MWYTSIHHELTSLSFKTAATSGGTPSQNICKNSTFSLWEPPTISPNQIPWCLSSAAKLAIGINAANFKVLHPCVFGVKWSKSSKIQIRWNYQNHREKGFLSGMNFFETSYIPSNIDSSSKSPHEIINCGRFPLWNIWKIPEFHFSVQPYLLCWSCKGNLKKYTICGSRNPDPQWCRKWWSCISWLSKHSSNLQANLQTWATTFNWFRKLIQRWWQPENPGWPTTWVGWMVRCNLAQKW